MSHVPNAQTSEDQNGIKSRTVESEQAKSGVNDVGDFLLPIHSAAFADQSLMFRTIQTSRFTGIQNILILREQLPSVALVIGVSIPEDSRAQTVKRLVQSKKVNAAIDALLRRIRNELYFAGNTGSEPKIKAMQLIGKYSGTDGRV